MSAKKEINRLADFILKNYPNEIGKGNFKKGESAVNIAIRLLIKLEKILKNRKEK